MHATMDPVQAIVLALVQGLSEFLPISSSGHLVLVPYLFGWADQGLAFDVAVHVGTLFAVVTYFRRELAAMVRAWFASLAGGGLTRDARLAWCVILGTMPVGIVGPRLRRPDRGEAAQSRVGRDAARRVRPLHVARRPFRAARARRVQRRLARRAPDRLRPGARAHAGHLALRRHDDDGAHARPHARGGRALLLPARRARASRWRAATSS